MTVRALFILGTANGSWMPLAKATLRDAEGSGELVSPAFRDWVGQLIAGSQDATQRTAASLAPLVRGGIDARASAVLPQIDAQFPDASYLLFCEHPGSGLATALAEGYGNDPAAWLREWNDSATQLLRHVQRARNRCLLVDTQEALEHPVEFARACMAMLGHHVPAANARLEQAEVDPLSQALGDALAFASVESRRLWVELHACCLPLQEAAHDPGLRPARLLMDGPGAVRTLQQLRSSARALEGAEAEARRLERQLEQQILTLRSELDDSEHRASAAREAALLNEQRAQASGAETSELLAVLERTQAELEAQFARANSLALEHERTRTGLHAQTVRADAQAADANRLRQALDEKSGEVGRLTAELERAGAALAGSQRELDDAANRYRQGQAEIEDLRRGEATAKVEQELLLLQLNQVQVELEQQYLKNLRLEAQKGSNAFEDAVLDLELGQVLLGGERMAPPHRELTIELTGGRINDLPLTATTVRLVEHRGNPGLAVFANDSPTRLFRRWTETGREQGKPYMLLVPHDHGSRALLEAMEVADWLVLQRIVARIEARLCDGAAPLAPAWIGIARRLRDELAALPARFRFKELLADGSGGAHGELALRFSHVMCGTRRLPDLRVHWHPEAALSSLRVLAHEESGPPLLSWPEDAQQQPAQELHVPLTPDDPHTSAFWTNVSHPDRDFLLAFLAAWPAALASLQQDVLVSAGLAPGGDTQRVAHHAEALLPAARSALAALARPPSLLRRIARRLRRALNPVAGMASAGHTTSMNGKS